MALKVFDTSFLTLLTDAASPAPPPPAGIRDTARERLDYLIETLDEERTGIVVPAPVLTEVLTLSRVDFGATLAVLKGLARVRIAGFGERAALECALMLRKTGHGDGPKAKLKFDHQIVAIAKVMGVDAVYSDDEGVQRLCRREEIACFGVWDLSPRPVDPQTSMEFEP